MEADRTGMKLKKNHFPYVFPTRQSAVMKFTCAIGLALLMLCSCKSEIAPDVQLDANGGVTEKVEDSCASRSRCIIVYMAPWCPVCHASLPFVKDLRESLRANKDVGFKIIVGDDDKRRTEEMADEIEGLVFLDPDQRFKTALGVYAVPTWIVLDRERRVLKRRSEGAPIGGDRESRIDMFLTQRLGLGSEILKLR